MNTPQVPLHKLILMLAHTVDLVGQDDYYHGRRVGLIATQLAQHNGWSTEQLRDVYYAGLLHDCGVSSTRMHRQLVNAVEWQGAEQHCVIGHDLLNTFVPLSRFAPVIRYHHSRWEDLRAGQLADTTIEQANLIFLADRIDVLCAPFYQDNILLAHVQSIRDVLGHYRGVIFSPQWIDLFLEHSRAEAFWVPLMSAEIVQEFQHHQAPQTDLYLQWPEIQQAAQVMAQIVDAKSPFTHQHSAGVAQLASYLAGAMGANQEIQEMIAVAGLLHDIGKLQISDEILEAPRALDDLEICKMRSHSYITFHILQGLGSLGAIPLWAASHHEKLNGNGYPFRFGAADIPQEARIIAVADIYQALAQDRPYRKALAPDTIVAILQKQAKEGLIDTDIVNMVQLHRDDCHQAALA